MCRCKYFFTLYGTNLARLWLRIPPHLHLGSPENVPSSIAKPTLSDSQHSILNLSLFIALGKRGQMLTAAWTCQAAEVAIRESDGESRSWGGALPLPWWDWSRSDPNWTWTSKFTEKKERKHINIYIFFLIFPIQSPENSDIMWHL